VLVVVGELTVARDARRFRDGPMRTMERASRAEPGCVAFGYFRDADDAGRFHVGEAWRRAADLHAHVDSPHRARWRRAWPRYGVELRYLHEFMVRTQPGAQLLALAKVPIYDAFTVAVRTARGHYTVHCLRHAGSESAGTRANALRAIEHPGEWCATCRERRRTYTLALVLATFEVPDGVTDATVEQAVNGGKPRRPASSARYAFPRTPVASH
jgi:quinol monooxygenase YgiN